jgi:hypothetical protein
VQPNTEQKVAVWNMSPGAEQKLSLKKDKEYLSALQAHPVIFSKQYDYYDIDASKAYFVTVDHNYAWSKRRAPELAR